jgi:hypothetical protein
MRIVIALGLAAVLAAGCVSSGAGSAIPSQPPSSPTSSPGPSSSATVPAPSVAPSGVRPTQSAPSPSTPSPVPSGCPAAGAMLTVEAALAVDPRCLPTALVKVAGWWDNPAQDDLPQPRLVNALLRGRLPVDVDGLERAPFLPIDQYDLAGQQPFAEIVGQWVTVTMTLGSDKDHCYWKFPSESEGIWETEPPAWTCPLYGSAKAVTVTTPPASALAWCPTSADPIRVAEFTAAPTACFGTRTVELTGWFDTWYIIGGWEAPWSIEPGWLWSMQIGPVPTLSTWSNPADSGSLVLHVPPGSPVAAAERNRYVILTGHFARPAEYEACRFTGTTDMPDADAQSDCAQAFVVESVRDDPAWR